MLAAAADDDNHYINCIRGHRTTFERGHIIKKL
jgi:hypothetical protein